MKKILFILTIVSLLILPVVSFAVVSPTETIPEIITAPGDIIVIIDAIANWIFVILLAVAVIFILIAAFQFLTAGGAPERVSAARTNLLYAVVGVAVAVLAKGFIELVKTIAGI
ncbi:hypothetical protein IH779_00735 [Patescibacteria group bacterium]|nr:hypothetical protein [Patescibacteria group bacterium]